MPPTRSVVCPLVTRGVRSIRIDEQRRFAQSAADTPVATPVGWSNLDQCARKSNERADGPHARREEPHH
jgi:hypothetical protein